MSNSNSNNNNRRQVQRFGPDPEPPSPKRRRGLAEPSSQQAQILGSPTKAEMAGTGARNRNEFRQMIIESAYANAEPVPIIYKKVVSELHYASDSQQKLAIFTSKNLDNQG